MSYEQIGMVAVLYWAIGLGLALVVLVGARVAGCRVGGPELVYGVMLALCWPMLPLIAWAIEADDEDEDDGED